MVSENTVITEELREITQKEIALTALNLGCTGFGGIAGMVGMLENELVIKRKWIDREHFMDVLSTSYIIPGPNVVEIIMHCGKEKGGRSGLVIAGVCYILPSMLICLLFGYVYQQYSALPDVQAFIFGLRPATTALLIGASFRLSRTSFKNSTALMLLCALVFAGSLLGLNEVLLILAAGAINYLIHTRKDNIPVITGLLLTPMFVQTASKFSNEKLFFIFLKIGAVLYGSGYVLFAYMDESLVRKNHWLSRQQLMDAIAVGQITPGPILSSATFAGYLVNGAPGGVIATVAVFLPAFFISLFLHRILSSARKSLPVRHFLDGLNAACVSVIAVVGIHLLGSAFETWQTTIILIACLGLTLTWKRLSTVYIIVIGSVGGYLLLKL